jgi:hypothetical protein
MMRLAGSTSLNVECGQQGEAHSHYPPRNRRARRRFRFTKTEASAPSPAQSQEQAASQPGHR